MTDVFIGVGYVASLLAIAIAILKVSDFVRACRNKEHNTPAARAARRQLFESRVRSPDWVFYQSHLQRPVPQALRSLFTSANFSASQLRFGEIELYLSPIDSQALADNWVVPGVLPFAYSDADPIYLKPGANASNAVFITYHDGNDTVALAHSIEAFAIGLGVAT